MGDGLRVERYGLDFGWVLDAAGGDDIGSLIFWHVRRIDDLGNSFFLTAFPKQNSGDGAMGDDVSTDSFASIGTSKEGRGSWVALDLVCLDYMLVLRSAPL